MHVGQGKEQDRSKHEDVTAFYNDPAIASQPNQITVEVGANLDVVLHIEFKGEFSWGHLGK